MLPLEVEIPSLRVALQAEMSLNERTRLRLDELDSMDEKRIIAQQNMELYQARMARTYEKMMRPRAFRQGELVLVLKRPIIGRHTHGPKILVKWGYYVFWFTRFDHSLSAFHFLLGEDYIKRGV